MFLFRFTAKPGKSVKDHDPSIVGAHASVWVNFPEKDAALLVAKYYLQNADWVVENLEDVRWVTEQDYDENEEGRQYYQEALTGGSSVVVDTWTSAPEKQCETEHDRH